VKPVEKCELEVGQHGAALLSTNERRTKKEKQKQNNNKTKSFKQQSDRSEEQKNETHLLAIEMCHVVVAQLHHLNNERK
jgi:hypothetical protein